MFVRFDETDDAVSGTQLSKSGGGGAAIANMNTGMVIGLVEKDAPMTNAAGAEAGVQTHAEALVQVIAMAKYLKE